MIIKSPRWSCHDTMFKSSESREPEKTKKLFGGKAGQVWLFRLGVLTDAHTMREGELRGLAWLNGRQHAICRSGV